MHALLEFQPVFAFLDGGSFCADHFDAVFLEDAGAPERHGDIEAGRGRGAKIQNVGDVCRGLAGIGQVVEHQKADGDIGLVQLIGHQQSGVGTIGMADNDDRIGMGLVGLDDGGEGIVPIHEVLGHRRDALGLQFAGQRVHAGGEDVEAATEDIDGSRRAAFRSGGAGLTGGKSDKEHRNHG